jgi:hypothetical protein
MGAEHGRGAGPAAAAFEDRLAAVIAAQRHLAVLGMRDRLDDFNTLLRLRTSVGLEQRVPQE